MDIKYKVIVLDDDEQDAKRYRWLRHSVSFGGDATYIGEWCLTEQQIDEYVDEQMQKEETVTPP